MAEDDRGLDTSQSAQTLTGSCLCGGIQYEVAGKLGPVFVCHCRMCRKAQGTAFGTNAPVSEADFRFVKGEELLVAYQSSPDKWRCFCGRCGAPVYSYTSRVPGVLRLRLGLVDGNPESEFAGHIFLEDGAPWFEVDAPLPVYDLERKRQLTPSEREEVLRRRKENAARSR